MNKYMIQYICVYLLRILIHRQLQFSVLTQESHVKIS